MASGQASGHSFNDLIQTALFLFVNVAIEHQTSLQISGKGICELRGAEQDGVKEGGERGRQVST
jgi:hypothetical protein